MREVSMGKDSGRVYDVLKTHKRRCAPAEDDYWYEVYLISMTTYMVRAHSVPTYQHLLNGCTFYWACVENHIGYCTYLFNIYNRVHRINSIFWYKKSILYYLATQYIFVPLLLYMCSIIFRRKCFILDPLPSQNPCNADENMLFYLYPFIQQKN